MKSNGSKKPSRKEIEFSAEVLVATLRDHADHLEGRKKLTMRVTKVALPRRIAAIPSRDIAAIRTRLNVSQPVFAALLNVPLATARSWEHGQRKPSGAALRLLDLSRRHPEILVNDL